ncbi:trypsin-like serine protease [Tritonibacter multivorans]
MRRVFEAALAAMALCAPLILPAVTWAEPRDSSGLRRLDTIEAGRGWEAVGRLDRWGEGFCTGALIAPDLVLTAAHCLFDRNTHAKIDPTSVEFLAGWRNGRASAYRTVKRAIVHPDYVFDGELSAARVRNDLALLQLDRPIRNTTVLPFETDRRPNKGAEVGVVSYAHDRDNAPSLQEVCGVMSRQSGVLVLSCDVDYGSSGAPVFSFEHDMPRIVSVVSAKARVNGEEVSLGVSLDKELALLRAQVEDAAGVRSMPTGVGRVQVGGPRNNTGAKFIRN